MRRFNNIAHTLCQFLLLSLAISITGCSDGLSLLERIQSRGSLRVALIATPPLYFPDESLIRGYDYEIISAYADSIDVELDIIRADTTGEIITLLNQGKAHIGIAGSLPVYPDDNILYGQPYNEDKWYVIGHRNNNNLPKSLDEITPSTVIVAKDSKPALVLSTIKKNQPSLFWLELPNGNTRQVLEQVSLGSFKLSLVSQDVFSYYRYLYPDIKIAFTLPKQYSSHWLTNNNEDKSIFNSMNNFISQYKADGKLEKRYNTYFRHLNVFNYVDILYYLKRIETKLPDYSTYFEKAAKINNFDVRFLEAISYQESHWNENARSHTGVRGLMMLTNDTAKRVGVKDRLDPEQSIMGGAKYLNILKDSLPEKIQEPDRSWMTLAAYNVGMGHLEDARIITESLGDDPNLWIDVEKHLPKLSKKEWYKKTKHGYSRGHEPVAFVRRIRRYYDILRLYQQEEILEKLDKPLELDKLKINSPVF